MSKRYPLQVAAVVLSLLPCAGQAQTSTANFSVRMTIVAECAIASGGALDFGNGGASRASSNASTALQVTCSKATPYSIALSAGSGTAEDAATRRSSARNNAIGYRLTQASSQTASRDRETRSFLVQGQAAPEATLVHGTYTDTVTVTVTY